MLHINHHQSVRQAAHVFDAADAALQFLPVPGQHQRLFLGEAVEGAVLGLNLQLLQPLDGAADGLVVGEHAPQPTMVDIRHTGPLGLLTDDFGGGPLGADEQDLPALAGEFGHGLQRRVERGQGLFKVDDVDLVADAEDIRLHFGVPITGLMPEMNSCLEHFFNACSHAVSSVFGLSLHTPHGPTP